MAALETAIANVFEPTIAGNYMVEESVSRSQFVQAGILGSNAEIRAAVNQAGRVVDLPQWDDLVNSGSYASSVGTDTDDLITPKGATTDYDVAMKMFRNMAWATGGIVHHASGQDPLQLFMDRYANWWTREFERILTQKLLVGIFADATVLSNLGVDVSIADGVNATADNKIGNSAIEQVRAKLGDAYEKFTAIAMHSVPFFRLRSLGLIDVVPPQNQDLLAPGNYYQGLRVIVDDDMYKVAGGTSGYVYHSILFGPGAVAFESVPLGPQEPSVELYREPLKGTGSGRLSVITRQGFIMHPRGIKFDTSVATSAGGPTDAQLVADNWTQVWETKNIRIGLLKSNG